ncbi:ImmA/IrrE family metallo-endopeptidase [Vibrio vulnificus]
MTNPVTAKVILNALWDGQIPVNIESIIKRLSIDIRSMTMDEQARNPNSHAYADVEKNGQRYISLASHSSRTRERFTLAHELGHHALMHPLPKDRDEKSTYGMDYHEIEANSFAAEILMPEDSLRNKINRGQTNIQHLADIYEVSYDAMYYRLKNLGFILE